MHRAAERTRAISPSVGTKASVSCRDGATIDEQKNFALGRLDQAFLELDKNSGVDAVTSSTRASPANFRTAACSSSNTGAPCWHTTRSSNRKVSLVSYGRNSCAGGASSLENQQFAEIDGVRSNRPQATSGYWSRKTPIGLHLCKAHPHPSRRPFSLPQRGSLTISFS
jgi:hypothetical protein